MAHSVKYDVFHQILVHFSKYIIKLFQISSNFIIIINFKKLLTIIKFTLWAIFSRKCQNQFFSPSVDYSTSIDHYNVLKSCFRILNLIIEFMLVSKSGPRTKIGQLFVEISLLCHHKTSEIATSQKYQKK
jgi:hypothetical protein